MNAFVASRGKCTHVFAISVLLALPNLAVGQILDVQYYRGYCGAAAPIPPFLCPPGAVPVVDTNGPAGAPDGAVTGLDVPCNRAVDCAGAGCFTGVCTAPAAVVGASCNVPGDCGIGGVCFALGDTNDTTLLCWTGVLPPVPPPPPFFCADAYHGVIGPSITKGQEADGICPDGGIPAPAAAVAPLFWMLNTNGGVTANPSWMTCFDPNPPPGPAVSPIVAPSPPPFYLFDTIIDFPGIGPTGQGGDFLVAMDDPNNPAGFSTYYIAGMHDCAVTAGNNLGESRPFRCSTPGPNPGVMCGPGYPCTAPSVCLGMAGPIPLQAPDYDGVCGQARVPPPPPAENLCP